MDEKKKKILIFRLGAIGDVVHSTIISQAIKQKHSDCEIHFLTAKNIAPLLENNLDISKVLSFDEKYKDNLFYLIKLGLKLRKEKYDYTINLTNSLRNMFLNFISGTKKVVKRSIDRVHAVDAFYNTALSVFDDLEKPRNLKVYLSEEVKFSMKEKINKFSRPYLIISPGGENDNKRQGRIWVDDYWVEFLKKFTAKYKGTAFVCGSPSEVSFHQKYKNIENVVFMTGKLSLEESAALFSFSDLFVSGDSGPLHIASGLDVNTIGIMGSTTPESSAPYGDKGFFVEPLIDCKYCSSKTCKEISQGETFTPCMKSITPDYLLEFIENNKLI